MTIMLCNSIRGTLMGPFRMGIKCVNDAFVMEGVGANFDGNRVHGISHALSVKDLISGAAH